MPMEFWHKKTAKIACFVTGRVKMAEFFFCMLSSLVFSYSIRF